MQLGELAHESEADAEAPLAAIELALSLREQVEHLRKELGRNADAVVLHVERRLAAFISHEDADGPAGRRELRRVRQQVAHDLLEAHRIGVHEHGLGVDGHDAALELPHAREQVDAAPGRLVEPHQPQFERHLAAHRARDIEQVAEEAREVIALPAHDRDGTIGVLAAYRAHLQQVQRRGDRVQGIAQLVAQHREEHVSRPRGGFRFPHGPPMLPHQRRHGQHGHRHHPHERLEHEEGLVA